MSGPMPDEADPTCADNILHLHMYIIIFILNYWHL